MQAIIRKSEGEAVGAEQLAKINAFSRRELSAEEVYVFSLVLCDNEVDRDFERFPIDSLEKLAELFIGMTGVFDHVAKGENQTARIFETAVEAQPDRMTEAGEAYVALRGWAYMVRCEKNADLILEIDAGIKKEVSVSCAVERMICSICGADAKAQGCAHQPGERYEGLLCWRELCDPTDAYEWSFVAVPAQKRAGVTKRLRAGEDGELQKQLRLLEQLKERERVRREALKKQLVRVGTFALPEVEATLLERVAEGLSEEEIERLCKAMGKRAPFGCQLAGAGDAKDERGKEEAFGAFVI